MPESETGEQLYDIRLPDGTEVQMTKQALMDYQGDWQVNLATVTMQDLQPLLACLAHGDGVTCSMCGDDDV